MKLPSSYKHIYTNERIKPSDWLIQCHDTDFYDLTELISKIIFSKDASRMGLEAFRDISA